MDWKSKSLAIALALAPVLALPVQADAAWRKHCTLGIFCSWHHVAAHKKHYRYLRKAEPHPAPTVIKKEFVQKTIIKKAPVKALPPLE